jgi:hypothetical protein
VVFLLNLCNAFICSTRTLPNVWTSASLLLTNWQHNAQRHVRNLKGRGLVKVHNHNHNLSTTTDSVFFCPLYCLVLLWPHLPQVYTHIQMYKTDPAPSSVRARIAESIERQRRKMDSEPTWQLRIKQRARSEYHKLILYVVVLTRILNSRFPAQLNCSIKFYMFLRISFGFVLFIKLHFTLI